MNPLPPDPYLALGVPKTAQLSEIRSAHRKLVLKCHPDKVQDEALKAAKQDEFQKVQQAYELLSNETQRAQYDAQVKLNELRKEMGRGGPAGAGPGAGANVYYAEPRTSASGTYRPKATAQAYSSRYESDDARYSTPRKSSSYESKSKSSSKDEERRARRKEEERAEARREAAEREAKREKATVHSDRKKSRDKDRRKASEVKSRSYIESESDSEDIHRPTRGATRIRIPDLVDLLPKSTRRAAAEAIGSADRHREDTKAKMEHAYRYMKAASRLNAAAEAPRKPYVPDSPVIDTIEEEDTVRRSSGRTTRRPSLDIQGSSRRTQNSSRSRESPRLGSKDKKRSNPRMMDPELPMRAKPTLSSQKSAPPELPSSREKPQRSNTMDSKYSSKGSPVGPSLPRASTFHGNEKSKSRSTGSKRVVYESLSESDSDSDSPIYAKQPSPIREQRPPMRQKTSSYKIVRDINGQRAAERIPIPLGDVYEVPQERSPSPRRTAPNYPRTPSSRPANTRAPQSQPNYFASQSMPVPRELSPDREVPTVKTVRPTMRETQSHSQYGRPPSMYDEVKVSYTPSYGREDVAYSNYMRKGSDPEAGFSSYPSVNQAYKREEFPPRKAAAYT